MREALLFSMRLHALWLFEALDVRGRFLAPLNPNRLLILFIYYPAYLFMQGIHWIGFLLDEVFFARYRDVVIKEPLIITGFPSSSTSFIYRTLSQADHEFTSLKAWEALLAPSITEKKVLRWLADLDNKLQGRPLHKVAEFIIQRFTGQLSPALEIDMNSPMEDFLTLLPVGACFKMVMVFPGSRSLWQLGRFQEMPDDHRQTITGFHKACLQKHLYWTGQEKRMLTVNDAYGSWLPDLRFTYPDARYLFCIQEPGPALESELSSIRPAVEFFETIKAADTFSLELQTVLAHVYRILLKEKRSFFIDHLAVVDQANLDSDPSGELRRALKQLCVTVDSRMEDLIRRAASAYHDTHKHKQRPLDAKTGPNEFNTLVGSIYREILDHPYMTPNDRK